MVEKFSLKQNDPGLEARRKEGRTIMDELNLAEYLHISVDKVRDIKKRIEKNNGHLAIAVHPFYQHNFTEAHPKISIYLDDRPGDYLKERITQERLNPNTVPTIVMEEFDNVQATINRLGSDVAIISTAGASGLPWLIGHEDSPTDATMEQSRRIYLDVLASLGVKSVILSGLFRFTCVKQVGNLLVRNGYLVDISKNSYQPSGIIGEPKKSTGKVK